MSFSFRVWDGFFLESITVITNIYPEVDVLFSLVMSLLVIISMVYPKVSTWRG